jgi:Rieske Fe-S protein
MTMLNRRQFMRYGLNSAAGVLAASLGVLGFASILMPGGGSSAGDSAVKYWAKGREDSAWYGSLHLETMKKSDFVAEAAKSKTNTSGASGVWMGLPVTVNFVPHSINSGTPEVDNKPRFQLSEGYDATGKYVGHIEDLIDKDGRIFPTHDIVMIFSRCTHLCCIPGWQLVENTFTEDHWSAGGTDSGGTKLFCICHSSRFDPTMLEMNTNRNRADGSVFNYAGIRRSGGPAPVGLPIIPVEVTEDIIEGLAFEVDGGSTLNWLTYCD